MSAGKSKTGLIIGIVAGVAVLGVVGFVIYKKSQSKKQELANQQTQTQSTNEQVQLRQRGTGFLNTVETVGKVADLTSQILGSIPAGQSSGSATPSAPRV